MTDKSPPESVKDKRAAVPTVSRRLPDGTMIELLYHPDNRETSFALSKEGVWRIAREIQSAADERLIPFSPNNNIIKNEVVVLPSEPTEYGSKGELLQEVRRFVHRYVDVSPAFEGVAAHYVLFTWLYDAFQEVPYLRFQGDFGTGKTRALLVLGSLCYKGFFASGASTVSPLFHILSAFRGTLILDEADFRFSDEKAEIVKILNNGNVAGMPVLRTLTDRNREFNPQAFHVYGPKVVAMRGAYEDRALESRFFTEVMGTVPLRGDIPINLAGDLRREALLLRNKLLLFRFRNWHATHLQPTIPDIVAVPRFKQMLTPLLSVIDTEEDRQALLTIVEDTQENMLTERGLSTEAQLLEIVQELAGEAHKSVVPILEIASRFSSRFGVEYERPITPRWVGTILRRRLHLSPFKSHGRYVLGVADQKRLGALYERYGLIDLRQ
jgi:hypothetical protein